MHTHAYRCNHKSQFFLSKIVIAPDATLVVGRRLVFHTDATMGLNIVSIDTQNSRLTLFFSEAMSEARSKEQRAASRKTCEE